MCTIDDKYTPITVDLVKQDLKILNEVKWKMVHELFKQGLLGRKYVYLGDFYIPRSLEELRKIVIDYNIGSIEEPEDRDIAKVKVYTNVDIWKRAREIDQFLLDGLLELFKNDNITINKETEYDVEIIKIRGFDFSERDGKLIITVPKKDDKK